MNAPRELEALRRSARRRAALDLGLQGLPLLALLAAAVWRWGSSLAFAALAAVAGAALLGWLVTRRLRSFDARWLVRRLDAGRRDLDDSAELLFADPARLGPLQGLQRERLQQRLRDTALPDLRPAWSARRIALAVVAAVAGIAALWAWPPAGTRAPAPMPPAAAASAAPSMPRLTAQSLRIEPPAYTGLPARDEASLDAKAPQGARLHWRLRFEPPPAAAELAFVDGDRLPLRREGDEWRAERTLERPSLYRVLPDSPAGRLYRLDALPDRPPEVRAVVPEAALTLAQPGQSSWTLVFEASDDYGLAPEARLALTLAQGGGENVRFREEQRTLAGRGTATLKRYEARIDLHALGLGPGDDLVARIEVRDNRAPSPQAAQSPSLVLRLPAPQPELASGLEATAQKVLPAYFSSQRQIIIDAQALLAGQRTLSGEQFLARSDRIGADQRLLRLRYGQFLGEEAEGDAAPPKPHPALPTDDAEDEAHEQGDDHGHAHGGAPAGEAAPFGSGSGIEAEFGHTHDSAEAATLLDPRTKATLKSALDQMWQSELALRQGHPKQALPFAEKALGFIKQVQQADRIYLARVGPQLPPLDMTRRMTGKRDGIADRALPPPAAGAEDAVPARAWAALEPAPGAAAALAAPDLDALQRWLAEHAAQVEARGADALALRAALERLRADPGCADCRAELRAHLWRVLERPPVAVPRRAALDEGGQRYLDALAAGREGPR